MVALQAMTVVTEVKRRERERASDIEVTTILDLSYAMQGFGADFTMLMRAPTSCGGVKD